MASRYEHIVWDWNGTLLDDAWLCIEVLNGILGKRGRSEIDAHVYRQNFGFPVIRFYEFLGFDFQADSFDLVSREFIDAYEARWLDECLLHPETETILSQLTASGLSHSVLSAAEQTALETGIRHYGLSQHFVRLVGADNIYANGKTERGRQWIGDLGKARERVVLVGDTLHDYEVAEAMGIDCILLAHGHHSAERLNQSGARVAENHLELLELLR